MSTSMLRLAVALTVLVASSVALASNPMDTMNTSELATYWGYQCETYIASTSDGWQLTMFRLPNPGKPVVLVQHGLLDTSDTWLLNQPAEDLPLVLWQNNYDVFLGNIRGNKYGTVNAYYTPDEHEYWDWSWDQNGAIDLPALVQTALSVSGASQLSFVGHSQGGAMGFVGLSTVAVLQSQINLFVALAPVTFMYNQESQLLSTAASLHVDKILALDVTGIVLDSSELKKLMGAACVLQPSLCDDLISSLAGPAPDLNVSLTSLYTSHWPDTTSTINLAHWIKMARDGAFESWTGTPYDVTTIQTPVAIFGAALDELGDLSDLQMLASALPNVVGFHELAPNFGHLSFNWGTNTSVWFPTVLSTLASYKT